MNRCDTDVWTRRGITFLWNASRLAQVCRPEEALSVRAWLRSASAPPLPSNGGRALVVAGVDAVLDALDGAAADWIADTLKPAVIAFQRAHASTTAALVLWLPGKRRIRRTADGHYRIAAGPTGDAPLRRLFGGSEDDLEHIVAHGTTDDLLDGAEWHGLYHPRIT